jgi:hypothetical protein
MSGITGLPSATRTFTALGTGIIFLSTRLPATAALLQAAVLPRIDLGGDGNWPGACNFTGTQRTARFFHAGGFSLHGHDGKTRRPNDKRQIAGSDEGFHDGE